MGAGMIVRRNLVLSFGGFDDQFGPGSKFLSAEDYDIAIHSLIYGYWVGEISITWVVHDGFRTFVEFRELTRRDWIAIGAVYGKYLRCYHFEIIPLVIYNSVFRGLLLPLFNLKELRRPTGFKRFFYLYKGMLLGISTPVSAANYCFNSGKLQI